MQELSATKENVDDEWAMFMLNYTNGNNSSFKKDLLPNASPVLMEEIQTANLKSAPKCSELHISTKTKVLYLNCPVDTMKTFWRVPVIDYWRPIEGIIKKQTKITSHSQEELNEAQERLLNCGHHYTELVIKNAATTRAQDLNGPMQPPTKRLKFKDDRKVTIGISKKDIMNCRGKPKKAFMNCFAIIIRFHYKGEFREVHVKVFNTVSWKYREFQTIICLDLFGKK